MLLTQRSASLKDSLRKIKVLSPARTTKAEFLSSAWDEVNALIDLTDFMSEILTHPDLGRAQPREARLALARIL